MKSLYPITLFFLLSQSMTIDEHVLNTSFSDLVKDSMYVKLDVSNSQEYGLTSYDFCTVNDAVGYYDFLEYSVERLAVKIDVDKKLKEVLLIIKVWDSKNFYQQIVEKYGMPDTSSLSGYYIEKHGFKIPPEISKDSLEGYYDDLPQPKVSDFHEIRSVTWYDLNKNSENTPTDLHIRNKSNPTNKFTEKEIWVSFKRAK